MLNKKKQKIKKNSVFKKTLLGVTTAALTMGGGGAQAGKFSEALQDTYQNVCNTVTWGKHAICGAATLPYSMVTLDKNLAQASVKSLYVGTAGALGSCMKVLTSPFALSWGASRDAAKWAAANPYNAMMVTAGVACGLYRAAQNKDNLSRVSEDFFNNTGKAWVERGSEELVGLLDFFGWQDDLAGKVYNWSDLWKTNTIADKLNFGANLAFFMRTYGSMVTHVRENFGGQPSVGESPESEWTKVDIATIFYEKIGMNRLDIDESRAALEDYMKNKPYYNRDMKADLEAFEGGDTDVMQRRVWNPDYVLEAVRQGYHKNPEWLSAYGQLKAGEEDL